MRYVVLRDDDVNATTEPDRLLSLWAPCIAEGIPVTLSVIPEVALDARCRDGSVERFVTGASRGLTGRRAIGTAAGLCAALRETRSFRFAQHGLSHAMYDGRPEMDLDDTARAGALVDRGLALIDAAGLGRPVAFVAPQDGVSRASLLAVAGRFRVVSGGWYSLARVPRRWWPAYLMARKVRGRSHWRAGPTMFLSHPGCLLAPGSDPAGWVDRVLHEVEGRRLTVVVVHHWEFFDEVGSPDRARIAGLHAVVAALASRHGVRLVGLDDVASGAVPIC